MFKVSIFTDQRPLTREQFNARTMRRLLAGLCAQANRFLVLGESADELIHECCVLSGEAQAFDPLPLN